MYVIYNILKCCLVGWVLFIMMFLLTSSALWLGGAATDYCVD